MDTKESKHNQNTKIDQQTRDEEAEPNKRLLLRKPCAAPSLSSEIGD